MKKLDKNSLIAEFDVRHDMSWVGLNDDLSLTSLVKQIKYNEVNLEGTPFGKNMHDAGVLTFNQVFSDSLTLFPVTPNLPFNTGETYDIIPTTCEHAGLYFDFQGGLLIGNFAFDKRPYNILPKRFINGFTFDISVHVNEKTFGDINESNDGIFLFLGARAEDTSIPIEDGVKDIYGNIMAFKFNDNGRVGYKYINDEGLIVEDYSKHSIKSHGWKIITITYIPEGVVLPHLAHCTPRRRGELCIYVNGLPYLTVPNFEEPMFRGYSSGIDSSLGLPFSMSIGGGSFGLKHQAYLTESIEDIDNGVVGEAFGGSFNGGIQVVRMYDKHMLFDEVVARYNEDAEGYGLRKLKGGRVIRYE